LLEGHVSLHLDFLDRIYLNGYVPRLQTSGQVAWFITDHLGMPRPVSGGLRAAGQRLSQGGTAFRQGQRHPGDPPPGGGLDKSTTGSTSTYVVRDPEGNLIGYKDASGNHWYYLLDGHGSVIAVINNSGSTVGNRYGYDEYGRTTYTQPSPTVTQPWGYSGGYRDPTGLIKFGDRYYDPSLGRWTQQDSHAGALIDPASIDRSSYVGDDPENFVDPTGFDCKWHSWHRRMRVRKRLWSDRRF
jgi:RHS repeat-associated protein